VHISTIIFNKISPEDSCVFYRSTEGGGLPPRNILS